MTSTRNYEAQMLDGGASVHVLENGVHSVHAHQLCILAFSHFFGLEFEFSLARNSCGFDLQLKERLIKLRLRCYFKWQYGKFMHHNCFSLFVLQDFIFCSAIAKVYFPYLIQIHTSEC